MTKFLIVYVGQNKKDVIFGNEVLWLDAPEVGEDDLKELKDCIAMRRNLRIVTIVNIIKLGGQ